MGLVEDIENQVKDYLDGDYEVEEIRVIPSVENVPFGKKAKKMNLCTFCIDLRDSSSLMLVQGKGTSGKIHKAFLAVVSRIIVANEGKIRSFQGDSLLAFWPACVQTDLDKAVKSAMTIKWLLNDKLSNYFEQYQKLDFGIGIDFGEVYILRAGISRDANNNDLVYIGNCVNFAVAIANQAKSPNNIEISNSTYENLSDEWKYGKQDGKDVNMWSNGEVNWKGINFKTKITTWYNKIKS